MKVRAISGLTLFIIGLTKKVLIADLIATQIDPLLSQIDNLSIIDAWLVSTGYMMQIYFDFSGYSEMAIGLGRFFGIELPLNFNRPYLARNPIEFWKRWHISLSLWLRDYLYIPLGGSRSSKFRTNLNLMLTMVLGGFWHGANWTFVTWGAIHGMALLIYRNFKIENSSLLSRFGFLLLLLFSWVFFRSQNVSEALIIIKRHFVATHLAQEINFFLIFLILMGIVIVIFEPNFVLITEKRDKLSIKYKIIFGLLLGVCISFFARTSIFLYFQF